MEWNCSASHSGHAENGFLVSERSYFILMGKGERGLWERAKGKRVVSFTRKLFKVEN
jgi:hypothetical protein